MRIDEAREVDHVHALIREVLSPVLDRINPLMDNLGMQITDSDYLSLWGLPSLLEDATREWAKQLANPLAATYPGLVARDLIKVAFGDEVPAEFWRTELGQICFKLDAFPPRSAAKVEAAAVLRMTRQGVLKAARRGALQYDRHDNNLITRASVTRFFRFRQQQAELTTTRDEEGEE